MIREVTASDDVAIYAVHEAAFGQLEEPELVQTLHHSGAAVLSLVAEEGGAIVGHILYTALALDPPPAVPCRIVALAPLAVVPGWQRKGVGESLMYESMARLEKDGWDGIIVLGHPEYYPRFGFVPASNFGIGFPREVPEDAFLALPLREGALDDCPGTVVYHPAFGLT